MARYSKWLHVPRWNMLVFAPAKGGSSSLYHEIAEEYGVELETLGRQQKLEEATDVVRYTPSEAAQLGLPAVQYVRHPMHRFESLWRDKARDGGTCRQPIAGLSPADLLDFIIEHDCEDHHWTHQHVHQIPRTILRPTAALNKHEHRSTPGQIPPYSRVRLLEHYKSDVALWRRATARTH